ncbi:MAG: hypothetical protein SFU86_03510 [Pirellulaceae bacterium]|nr:hypothetical protein [Pirellulaceae bacterium]
MLRQIGLVWGIAIGVGLLAGVAKAQEIERGTLKKLDLANKVIVISSGGKDRELALSDETRVLDAQGTTLAERLQDFQAGAELFFVAGMRDGQPVARGLKLAAPGERVPGARPANPRGDGRPVSPEHASLKPLDELGTGMYHDFVGGFYPEGKNERPAAHEAAGLKLAAQVRPLDSQGQPDPAGKIVLLSIGMSNTSQSSQGFQSALGRYDAKNPSLLFVNGAVGGMTAAAIRNPSDGGRGTQYWNEVDNRLKQAGVSREQVQAVWIKQANAGPTEGFPRYAQQLQADLKLIVQVVAQRFPKCRLCYLTSRTYGGFATTGLNPEPYAYESGFSVKWLIEEQLGDDPALNYDPAKGAVKAPWLSWGPYFWANGQTKRASDGFSWEQADFAADGTHQSSSGQQKVGTLLLDFFKSDSTAKGWFNKP